jgi:surface antigen
MPARSPSPAPIAAALAGLVALVAPGLATSQAGGDAAAQGWRKAAEPYFLGAGDRKWLQDYGVVDGRCNRQAVEAVVNAGPTGPETPRNEVAVLRGPLPPTRSRRALTDADRACLGHALELAPAGRAVYWADPAAGYSYRVTVLRGYSALGWPCREFAFEMTRGKQAPEIMRSRACRTEDGVWGIVT